jgi:DNA-binding transcriptional ArsR family regulator
MKGKESNTSVERVLKALANRRRIAIVRYLKTHKKATVGDIAEDIKLSVKSTSKHLALLAAVDILDREQQSTFYVLQHPAPARIDSTSRCSYSLIRAN